MISARRRGYRGELVRKGAGMMTSTAVMSRVTGPLSDTIV